MMENSPPNLTTSDMKEDVLSLPTSIVTTVTI